MKTVNAIQMIKNFDQVTFNNFIYELDDDGLLIECKFTKNNKSYFATISPNFNEVNELSNLLLQQQGIDLNSLLSENLLKRGNPFAEWNCTNYNIALNFTHSIAPNQSFAA